VKSCIYRGTVRHRRVSPVKHHFTYSLFMMYLDLEELPTVFAGRWLWSSGAAAPAWFRRADYLGDGGVPLPEAVRAEAERLTGHRPQGPIRMLTHLRYFGYVMNPVTFYYCFDADDSQVELILAEITNTPWNERHTYALSPDPSGGGATNRPHRFAKSFHVSPFMSMDHEYTWRFSDPEQRLMVHMENRERGEKPFDATLRLHREEISGGTLARALLRYPWMTARVALGIYWQALRLRLKKTPYHDHPQASAA
jgi:DUF1365 family protein